MCKKKLRSNYNLQFAQVTKSCVVNELFNSACLRSQITTDKTLFLYLKIITFNKKYLGIKKYITPS